MHIFLTSTFTSYQKSNKDSSQSTSKLDMNNLSGLFTVIALGIVTSFLFLIAEYTFACFEDVYGNEFRDPDKVGSVSSVYEVLAPSVTIF